MEHRGELVNTASAALNVTESLVGREIASWPAGSHPDGRARWASKHLQV